MKTLILAATAALLIAGPASAAAPDADAGLLLVGKAGGSDMFVGDNSWTRRGDEVEVWLFTAHEPQEFGGALIAGSWMRVVIACTARNFHIREVVGLRSDLTVGISSEVSEPGGDIRAGTNIDSALKLVCQNDDSEVISRVPGVAAAFERRRT